MTTEPITQAVADPKTKTLARRKRKVFIDMDGVIVDFEAHMLETGLTSDQIKPIVGAYAAMKPIGGALESVRSVIGMGFEVWIATKPPTGIAHAYADKVSWVLEHLPELKRRIIVTHNKGLLGGEHDFLIDDRPHKADCESFSGTLIRFGPEFDVLWVDVLDRLRKEMRFVPDSGENDAHAVISQPLVDLELLTRPGPLTICPSSN